MRACRYAKEVCDAIVAKCLTGRPKTVEKAQAAFMLWVELEAVDAFLVSYAFWFGCLHGNTLQCRLEVFFFFMVAIVFN